MKMPNEFRKKWVTIDDIEKFTIKEDEKMGEKNKVNYGILFQGKFEGCHLCNKCQFGRGAATLELNTKRTKSVSAPV